MATQMRTYETICLTKVDMPEDKYKALVDKCKDAVTSDKGQVLMLDLWGKAKIAYPINKERSGHTSAIKPALVPSMRFDTNSKLMNLF